MSDEPQVLLQFLDVERDHVLGILEGLSEEQSNAIITTMPLDMAPRQPDPRWGAWGSRFSDLRFVMLHVLKETSCHAGHLDAVRELIDGRQWIVLGER